MFQYPGVGMGNEYRINTSRKRRIDVRLRTVPDHPRALCSQGVALDNFAVVLRRLVWNNFHCGKMFLQARATYFTRLFGMIAFSDEDQVMPLRKILQSWRDIWQKLHRLFRDGSGEAMNGLMQC